MGYVLTGYKRSLSVTVTKTINGIAQAGYPKTYPTATDISNGYFTYNAVQYAIPPNGMTETAFARLTDIQYNTLLNAFRLYVMSLESGLDFNTQSINSAVVYDATTCPPGTVIEEGTTTTTEEGTTTTTEGTTTTTPLPSSLLNLRFWDADGAYFSEFLAGAEKDMLSVSSPGGASSSYFGGFLLRNDTLDPSLSIGSVAVIDNASGLYSMNTTAFPQELSPGESQAFSVEFAGNGVGGTYTCTVRIPYYYNAAWQNYDVDLTITVS